jgi:hypothetical protein
MGIREEEDERVVSGEEYIRDLKSKIGPRKTPKEQNMDNLMWIHEQALRLKAKQEGSEN